MGKLAAYAAEEWYPSRIAFGKHKGRLLQEARKDTQFRRWLEWLASSFNARSAKMGRWYLRQLEMKAQPQDDGTLFAALVIYVNPELAQLRQFVASERARLAELETDYTREKSRVDAIQAILFRRLREHYQKRDRLGLVVEYRKKYLDLLGRGGDEEAKQTEERYKNAKTQTEKDYEETAAAVAGTRELTAEEETELKQLWKKLVKLYPRTASRTSRISWKTYHKLTSAINRAKEAGDIKTLREIAEDPHGYILRQCWASLDFSDEVELSQLRRLHETLQMEVIAILEALNQLRESADYELCRISEQKPGVLDELAAERKKLLESESAELETQARRLADEIKELSGEGSSAIN